MDYTSIHVYGHLLSDDIMRQIETDKALVGNRENDFRLDSSLQEAIDYAWTSLKTDWNFYHSRNQTNDPYGTRRSREFIGRLLSLFGFELLRLQQRKELDNGASYDITWLCPKLHDLPVITCGERTNDSDSNENERERCSLDYRAKGNRREKSPHASMLEYLNNTENIYGIIANGPTLRLIRNAGQLVKLTYIEFDLRKMLEEDKYAEFSLMFRILHASRFVIEGDAPSFIEQYFNLSIESGNRIRAGLSQAAQSAMTIIGHAAVSSEGKGNDELRAQLADESLSAKEFNKELIHFIYRLLFLFIIEDRGLVYDSESDSEQIKYWKEIYYQHYAASRFRTLSELSYVRSPRYFDLWEGLMDTFRLFEDEKFGSKLGIKPLGGVLFNANTLSHLRPCRISNQDMFDALHALNVFTDEQHQVTRINYSSLDVEEFGSVYEGILEQRPALNTGTTPAEWEFDYVGGLDRQSTSSYYTRPDLVQSLIRTTLEPVIQERLAACNTQEDKIASLLAMKVCDAACGSGHVVLAMARTIAWYVCSIRTGEDNPASMDYRRALHEVIERCVYAVDYNPDAVELCKVVLWIEGYCAGKPLSFLDHHIRCGNSVVGVANLDTLLEGVPNEAFEATDKDTLKQVTKINKQALAEAKAKRESEKDSNEMSLFGEIEISNISRIDKEQISLADKIRAISAMPENDIHEQAAKQHCYDELMQSPLMKSLRLACDIYTAAFYYQFSSTDISTGSSSSTLSNAPYTGTVYQALDEIKQLENPYKDFVPLTDAFKASINQTSSQFRFFHWCIEFPEIFANEGGFDVMCGNPPWDQVQMEDERWFLNKDSDIANAPNQSARNKKIQELQESNPKLYLEYLEACHDTKNQSNFVKNSGRFILTNHGKIELSAIFAELCLCFSKCAWGLVLPTGIAINDSTKDFFAKLIDENRLISLYDFENREALFNIHRMFKFCLLTAGKAQSEARSVQSGFYLTRLNHLSDTKRTYRLQTSDFALLNPNSKNCPIFRTNEDAALTTKIYRNCGHIVFNDQTKENPWLISLGIMFNMSSDSNLFRTYQQLSQAGATLTRNRFTMPNGTVYVPLYEGKMIWYYNHHFGTWPTKGKRPESINSPSLQELQDACSCITPWYWLPAKEVESRFCEKKWKAPLYLAFRKIARAVDVRTFVITGISDVCGFGDSITLAYSEFGNLLTIVFLAQLASIPFDYVTRQKVGGINMNLHFVKQFPILAPEQIPDNLKWEMAKRAIELTYFNHDLDNWAATIWEEMSEEQRQEMPTIGLKEPFVFDPERRAVLQAELDAIVAHLFGLTTKELRYILDPEDIFGEGCVHETFRVLKETELRAFGEYRTKRLVLEAWQRFHYDN